MPTQYLEIITKDVPGLCATYEAVYGLAFGDEDKDLGGAKVATREGAGLVGIRPPLADHESPMMRAYLAVEDIKAAVKAAEDKGAMIAFPPTSLGLHGTFAIFILGGVEHGLWERKS